jgi:DNA-binding transcriptional ArsR family regulator
VDLRTANLLDSLGAVPAALLLELLAGPATEAELVARLDAASQPTTNRHLHELRRAGVVAQEGGKRRAPGRLWTLVHPSETEAVLKAILDLAEAIDAWSAERRRAARKQLATARAARLGIREAHPRRAADT